MAAPELQRLTDLATCGGCAAKYSAVDLRRLVGGLAATHPQLLVGLGSPDDAAVYRLNDDQALVFTVDFFPPVVDDPADFGAIAAANALSDVFAMGGRPLLALSVAAFPESLDASVVSAIFAAAASTVESAGAMLVGGHTVRDTEPKYGLTVVGTVAPDAVWTKAGAKPGDALYLTKPLGTGLLLHAHREGLVREDDLQAAVGSMRRLNLSAAAALERFGPSAVTDVTGFGLLGHAREIAEQSGVTLEMDAASLPLLSGARAIALTGVRTGGHRRNLDYADAFLDARGVDETDLALALDPQTSGGLLVSLPSDSAGTFERSLDPPPARIGRVVAGPPRVVLAR